MSQTFKVSVEALRSKGTNTLGHSPVAGSLGNFLGGTPLEAARANSPKVLRQQKINGLLHAVHVAYSDHYPLALSPDDVWLAIAQGFALHVNANAETLRAQFVSHEGKKEILHMNDYTRGDPNTPWENSFAFFSSEIEKHIGKKATLLTSDFTTTGPIEKAASEIVLMDSMQKFFSYREMTMCGIPEVTLLGTTDDWKSIRHRVQNFDEFGLAWWTACLLPVIDKFVDASQGRVDVKFWDNLYKRNDFGSGGPTVSGWVNAFYPYLKNYRTDTFDRKTPYVERGLDVTTSTSAFPSGLSKVPFIWDYLGSRFDYEFFGGFVGAHQEEDLTIRPSIGWAVREVKK